MRLNTLNKIHTHEGASAKRISDEDALRRSVLSCLLWEKEFYESGQTIADRITGLADKCSKEFVGALAVEARSRFNLRHVPLLLLCSLVKKGGPGIADVIEQTIQRADEMAELLALYWRDGRKPISKQMQRGLARAFVKFDEYALAKYDRDGAVRLRDVLFLSHAKPTTPEQKALFKRVADRELVTPDTWEVALSGGADKRQTFTRMLSEGTLGYLALLRNLRNMVDAGVERALIVESLRARKGARRVLPFRYVAAARACPQLENHIDQVLLAAIEDMEPLSGTTAVLVDVSGSMQARLSGKSDMTRLDAACALASVIKGDVRMFSFSTQVMEVPARRGMAGIDTLQRSQHHGATYLGASVRAINDEVRHDRLIVITDEQSADRVPDPVAKRAYMINVASSKNGVGYGKWTHIDGFSEQVLRFISEIER